MRFNIFKKEKLAIFAPVNGDIIPLSEVPDPVFSQKMMGEGIAMVPEEGKVTSPVKGNVILVADTKHAVGIRAVDGTEILIHVGLETVSLNGEGFTVAVNVGDKVAAGQLLMKVDLDTIKVRAKSIITPIVITNSHESGKQYRFTQDKKGTIGETVIITEA
ncbi:PTS system glucose-specific IIA component [Bacillus sp. SORGH_AS 510]|uniref:PTS sugar transporter subunit IIA n=1 Tax=Bacillus sp. SORGH_AS_0510 TaxID=3041771 RepID=UPI00277E346B|nr:PTS glucose transporter subunit IIA [Bacillus sp. SORGH_AS_0510]MDQ1147898.1 PTS system glucose-specific IIA component [Bacillus sp. SORGH_AS_0510]